MENTTRVSKKPMSIALIGAGNIGSTFAYYLARAGHHVTAIARPGSTRLMQLRRDSAIILLTGERAVVTVADALDEEIAYDLVVVTVLAHQLDPILPALKRSKARCIHFMFNNFEPHRLKDLIGPDKATFGMPFVQSLLDTDGKLTASVRGQKTLHSDQRWVQLFIDAGMPSVQEENMLLWLRCHAPICVAFESISVAGQRRGGGASWTEAMTVARGVHGGFAIIEGLGDRIYPFAKSVMNSLPVYVLASIFWSLSRIKSFRELLATGLNECRAIADKISAAGKTKPELSAAVAAVLAMKPTV